MNLVFFRSASWVSSLSGAGTKDGARSEKKRMVERADGWDRIAAVRCWGECGGCGLQENPRASLKAGHYKGCGGLRWLLLVPRKDCIVRLVW
jgi:hypothetical protein